MKRLGLRLGLLKRERESYLYVLLWCIYNPIQIIQIYEAISEMIFSSIHSISFPFDIKFTKEIFIIFHFGVEIFFLLLPPSQKIDVKAYTRRVASSSVVCVT